MSRLTALNRIRLPGAAAPFVSINARFQPLQRHVLSELQVATDESISSSVSEPFAALFQLLFAAL